VAATPAGAAADASGLVSSVVQLGFVGGVAMLGTFFLQHRSGPSPESAHAFASVALAASVLALAAVVPMVRHDDRPRRRNTIGTASTAS
jgi:hypothetical protein